MFVTKNIFFSFLKIILYLIGLENDLGNYFWKNKKRKTENTFHFYRSNHKIPPLPKLSASHQDLCLAQGAFNSFIIVNAFVH